VERPVDGLLVRNFELTDAHRQLAHEMLGALNQQVRVSRAMFPAIDATELPRQTFIIESIAQLALGLVNSSLNEGLLSDAVGTTDAEDLDDWQTRMERPDGP
jgi:hypothetical protein